MSSEKKPKKVFDFKEQLALGNRAEELFLLYYHEPITLHTTFSADFRSIASGDLIELKTDTYNMDKTPNFFWERWSDVANQKPGGPWQSQANRVKRYCYMFSRHNTYFEFTNLRKLTGRLEKMTKGKYAIAVKNKGWITSGYPLPREDFADLYEQYTFEHAAEDSKEFSIYGNGMDDSPDSSGNHPLVGSGRGRKKNESKE